MKKYLVLIGAAIFILALTMPAGAQMLTKSYGHMEFQTVYTKNPDFKTGGGMKNEESGFGAPGQDITYKAMYQRFRLFLEHGDAKTVKAVIGFEADSSNWGETAWNNTTTGSNSSSAANPSGRMGTYAADQVQLEIKWAYLEFVIPNSPVSMTVGIQPWNYGGRLWISNDAPGAKITARFAPHQVELFWFRENDNTRTGFDVRENYGLEWKMAQKDFNAYFWGNYLNHNIGITHDNPYWLGLGGGVKPGNIDVSGQIAYIGGKKEVFGNTKQSFDYSAFAAEVLGYYNIGPGLKVGAEGFYTSGNDANNQATKINRWQVATASEARSGFGNDRTVFYWMASGVMGYQHNKETSFDGFWYGRATAEYAPTKWVNLIFNYLYIGDTASGTPGVDANGATKILNSPISCAVSQAKDNTVIGQEINVIAKINIHKGFGYNIGVAYFIPGDVYDLYDAAGNKTKSAEAAWAFNTRLRYDF